VAIKKKEGGKPPAASQKGMTLRRRNTLVGLSFITPNFLGFFVLNLIPILFAFWLSFNRWDGYNPMEFAGLDNFKYIFSR